MSGLTCYRCRRVMEPWPLKRADICSPKHWQVCIRWPNAKDKAHGATDEAIAATTEAGRREVNGLQAMAYLESMGRRDLVLLALKGGA